MLTIPGTTQAGGARRNCNTPFAHHQKRTSEMESWTFYPRRSVPLPGFRGWFCEFNRRSHFYFSERKCAIVAHRNPSTGRTVFSIPVRSGRRESKLRPKSVKTVETTHLQAFQNQIGSDLCSIGECIGSDLVKFVQLQQKYRTLLTEIVQLHCCK